MQKDDAEQLQKTYPPVEEQAERTIKALDLYKKIAAEAHLRGWKIAFLSGLATDANFGYLTRQHRDADLIASKETAEEIKKFLESEGHTVYEPDEVKDECLKVDQAEPDKPMRCHSDIHYFWEEDGKIVIPAFGKKMSLSADFDHATHELEFMGVTARFLKPEYIIEEKYGWRDQVGMTFREEYQKEIDKINFLIDFMSRT